MEYVIHIGDRPITLKHDDIEDVVNVDSLTKIDTSNIFGEAVTVTAAVNRVGLMKAEVESNLAGLKLDCRIYENNYRSNLRKQSSKSGGSYIIKVDSEEVSVKLTEKALETCYESEPEWIELKREIIRAERNFNSLDALYWAIQDKSKKLNGFISNTTPEEFVDGLIEGKVNGILISKGAKAGSIK